MQRRLMVSIIVTTVIAIGGLRVAHAAAGFSDASLNGTYLFTVSGNDSAMVNIPLPGSQPVIASLPVMEPMAFQGQLQADGAGGITGSGSFIHQTAQIVSSVGPTYAAQDSSCSVSISGTYSINSDGSGTMTLSPTGSCINASATFRVQLAARGVIGTLSLNNANPPQFATILTGTIAQK